MDCPCSERLYRPEAVHGTIDWEAFFEHPSDGVIPLLQQAGSRHTLMQCSVVVVESLFTRRNDCERRDAFLRIVGDIIGPPEATSDTMDRAKSQLAKVFRHIKEDRLARAQAYIERKRTEEAAERRNEEDPLEVNSPAPAEPAPLPEPGFEEDVEDLFCKVFWEAVDARLKALRAGLVGRQPPRTPVPFLLSEVFAEHFGHVVIDEIAPCIAQRATAIIRPAEHLPPEERRTFLREQIDEYKNRRTLWETWQIVWKESTLTREIPEKPKAHKPGALDFLKKKPKAPAWRNEMSIEEWERESTEIRARNKRAKRIWAKISAANEAYDPPGNTDKAALMELFARSPKAISQQIQAMRQIASQGSDVGRAFDTYRKGKHPDLGLLAASFWHPEIFLGQKPVLKRMLSGYVASDLSRFMPYTTRYFGDLLA